MKEPMYAIADRWQRRASILEKALVSAEASLRAIEKDAKRKMALAIAPVIYGLMVAREEASAQVAP